MSRRHASVQVSPRAVRDSLPALGRRGREHLHDFYVGRECFCRSFGNAGPALATGEAMQPKPLSAHPTAKPVDAHGVNLMNTCAPGMGETAAADAASLELRHAQRAFAALVDALERVGEFRGAQMRRHARRTLSALSADDRTRLAEWLALQIAAATDERALALAARIDEALVARVRRALPARVEALAIRGRPNHIVAA